MLRSTRNLFSYISIVLVSSFLLLGISQKVFAADPQVVNYNVNVPPSLNINVSSSSVVLDLNPNSKTSDSKDLNVTVSTNNTSGYYLTMTTTGNSTDLVRDNTADGKNATIPTLTSQAGATPASLPDNTWGYRQDNTGNFLPFVSSTNPILENTAATNGDSTTLTFASKINYSQIAGSYKLDLSLAAVANPVINYMQDMDPTLCTTTPTTVVDKRDNKEYTIAKLADGQCWMTSNLNLAGGTKLYSETSDVPAGYPESGGTGYFTLPASSSTGFSDDTTAYVYNTGNETTNQADCNTSPGCNSYYSWLAATAGGKDASGADVTGDGYNAAYSICPKGWRLPTATTSNASATYNNNWKTGDFYKVATAYGANLESDYSENATTFYNNAGPGTTPNFLLAGYYNSSTFSDGGSYGHYWSSSSYWSTLAYAFSFGSSSVYSALSTYRMYGFPVRCVLADTRTISDITYMQDVNNYIIKNTTEGDTNTLIDTRDNQEYSVAKINGDLWMTKNLAIGCDGGNPISRTLQSTNTNIDSSYTTPTASLDKTDNTSGCTTSSNSGCNTTTVARLKCSATYGAWYNYVTTTAGTITGDSNSTNATQDICPKGWRLPIGSELSGLTGHMTEFGPVLGGNYQGGVANSPTNGYWWSSTTDPNTRPTTGREFTAYVNDSGAYNFNVSQNRYYGFFVRCIARQ